jgi:three-Cys-motif partner protein
MPPRKFVDPHDWLRVHLEPLMASGKKLAAFDENLPSREPPSYDRGYWTGLKLVALKYYLKPYLNILAGKTRVAYIDLFAGPGLDRIGKRSVPLPGSPLVPMMVHEAAEGKNFVQYIFCETKRDYYDALKARAEAYRSADCGLTMLRGDANERVDDVLAAVKKQRIGHSLVFLDPEGLEWRWSSMERLLAGISCDVIVNFPSAGLTRISTRVDTTRETISAFLGEPLEGLPHIVDEEWALERYKAKLADLGRDVSTEIRITDIGTFHYHLIPAVRTTRGGSPWFATFVMLRDQIRRLHAEILGMVAAQIDGELGTIA